MNWIFDHIKQQSATTAIIFNEKEYSYAQLYDKIEEYFQSLLSIPDGSIISIISDYSFESIALFFALYKKNAILVPITTKVESAVQERVKVSNSNYKIFINEGELKIDFIQDTEINHDLIRKLQNIKKAGLILFSSGSTGAPKAMIHNLDNLVDSFKGKKGKNLVFLIFLMFDHIGGLNTLLNCLSMGLTMVFPNERTPDHICSLIQKYHVNILPASPTFLNLIVISEAYTLYDLSSLRMITYGTEPMPESLLLKLKFIFEKVKFLQTFGTSETGISQSSSKSSTSTFLKIDDNNTEYKIVNNELWLKSKTQILGYLNSKMDRFTVDGWFKTGDMVEQGDDGYFRIIGRNSEIINVGGEKVFPNEVESILLQLPMIVDCVVFGETNQIMGQMVVAKVLFKMEIKAAEAKKLIVSFCKDKLERYKIPSKIIIMSESEFSERFKKIRI